MRTVTFKNKTYTLDRHGFLDPAEQWDENFAEGMTKALGIRSGLGQRHWQLIHYLRQKYLTENTVPLLVKACMDNQMSLAELRSRFPTGYHRGACKIAGINYAFMYEANIWLTYETAPPAKPRYKVNRLGFLEDFRDWDEDFPHMVVGGTAGARPLSERQWKVIRYLRRYYERHRRIPNVYETCRANALALGDLQELFPQGYRRGACRMAGLPFFS